PCAIPVILRLRKATMTKVTRVSPEVADEATQKAKTMAATRDADSLSVKVGEDVDAAGGSAKPAAKKAAAKKTAAKKTAAKKTAAKKTAAKKATTVRATKSTGRRPGRPAKNASQATDDFVDDIVDGEVIPELKPLPKRGAKRGKGEKDVPARALTPEEPEARRNRLKVLIKLGKDRGYLTYGEINDHLPDDLVDAEAIDGIISTFSDMGISVYDQAPDADTLLMSDATPVSASDDDVEDEA